MKAPLQRYGDHWMVKGEGLDPKKEYEVEIQEKVPSRLNWQQVAERLWRKHQRVSPDGIVIVPLQSFTAALEEARKIDRGYLREIIVHELHDDLSKVTVERNLSLSPYKNYPADCVRDTE